MKYMGSKARYAKEILPIILEGRRENQYYIEPFIGGANTFHLVKNPKIGSDVNKYLIAMLKSVGVGWVPPVDITEDMYNNAKSVLTTPFSDSLVGFIGIGCSYSGKWFGGYARGNDTNGNARNYASESSRNIIKQANGLKESQLFTCNYYDLEIPPKSIIYCDPPYMGTTKYSGIFDSSKFWEWCNSLVSEGHNVYVSEYNAPSDWVCVWKKEVNSSLTKDTGSKKATEKLFTKYKEQTASSL